MRSLSVQTEKFPAARIERVDMQYLYDDGDLYYFMNVETYDQVGLTKDQVGDSLKFVKENEMVKICSHNGNVFAIEPPLFVELEVTETEPGFAGNTAQGATKPATVETGAQVQVPLFVNQGDKSENLIQEQENIFLEYNQDETSCFLLINSCKEIIRLPSVRSGGSFSSLIGIGEKSMEYVTLGKNRSQGFQNGPWRDTDPEKLMRKEQRHCCIS